MRVLSAPHYSRQNPDSHKVGGPARQLVLLAGDPASAVWLSTYKRPEYVKHGWPGAWENSLFRNTGAGLSSELIREAVAATRAAWGEPPSLGMVSFVDADKVRHKRDPGRCYLRAGFRLEERRTAGGLLCFRLAPDAMPEPCPAMAPAQIPMFGDFGPVAQIERLRREVGE